MDKETLRLIAEIIAGIAATALTIRGILQDRLRARERLAVVERGGDPRSLPDIGPKPLLIFVGIGVALAYLISRHPEVAQRVLPLAESAESVAAATPAVNQCTKGSDCASGSCDRGKCAPESKNPKLPRRIAELEAVISAEAAAAKECSSNSECGSNGKCRGGKCSNTADKPTTPRPVDRRPRGAVASLDGTICADCLVMPLQEDPIDLTIFGAGR